jgi:hypothetical protein
MALCACMVLTVLPGISKVAQADQIISEVYIIAGSQYLESGEELDQTRYTVRGLEEKYTVEGIVLRDYEDGYVYVDCDNLVIKLGEEDVTDQFSITTTNGFLSRVCHGHRFDENGFCATGNCQVYEIPDSITMVDEYGFDKDWVEIANAGNLYWLAQWTNNNSYLNLNARLVADITVNEDLSAENLRVWTPIGCRGSAYLADFDGQGYTISGLYVNDPEAEHVGLFGFVDYGYRFKDIHLTNSYFRGGENVGGLFGYACCYVSGCSVSDTVTVVGSYNVGGIAANSGGGYNLTNCYSLANLNAAPSEYGHVGGLVGMNWLQISNSYTNASNIISPYNYDQDYVSGCYYLCDTETENGGKTAAQFASGEVAYLLQSAIVGEEIYDEDWNYIGTAEPELIWGQRVGVDSWPVLGGEKVYQVKACDGESAAYSNTDVDGAHVLVDGVCTICGFYTEAPTLTGKSFSLSFRDEILVNFYYNVENGGSIAEQGMLVFNTDPGTPEFALADQVYTGSITDGTKFMNTTTGIAAKYMGDSRYYCAYAKLIDGTYVYSPLYQYSPKQYAMNMLGKASTSAKQKALCVAMLNYGAAAQKYFGYNAANLMNSELTAEQQALVIAYDPSLFTGAVAADSSKTGAFAATSSGFSKRSATVSFEGAFCVNYYFTPNCTVSGDMTLYIWTPEAYAAADTLTAENAAGTMTMVAGSDGRYWGRVSGIAAKDLDETYYVAGVYTDADGNTYCTGVIAYSLSEYCMRKAVNGNKMQQLASAAAMYGYYAQAHFGA